MSTTARRTLVICLCLFMLGFLVRSLVWQTNKTAIDGVQYIVTEVYEEDARLLAGGDIGAFLTGPDPPSDATIIMHPPGYPIFIAAIYSVLGEGEWLRIVQMMIASLAAVWAFLLSRRLFEEPTAIVAGILTAIAPQFAYYSAIILPDELSAVAVIAGLYFLVRGWQEQRLSMMAASGVALGLSCWLRSNTVLLPVFIAGAVLVVVPRAFRIRSAAVITAAFVLTIAPMTIRNVLVFHTFVPVSVGFGTTFIEGLGEMDTDHRTTLPKLDEEVMAMDAENFGRPDYYGRLYVPDGLERESRRIQTGVTVIKQYPAWFALGVLKRGLMVFRMERVPLMEPRDDNIGTTSISLHFLNAPFKLLWRLFITAVFLPLALIGTALLLRSADGRRNFAILASVLLYFFLVQPIVHTEYRYLLPATHTLVLLASLPLGFLTTRLARQK